MKFLYVLILFIASAFALDLRPKEDLRQTAPVISPQERITNGVTVSIDKYNYQVGLSVNGGWCGGSLIKTTYVLTAAHCVKGLSPSTVIAYLGNATRTGGISRVAILIKVHPAYNASIILNDIALVKIGAVVLSATIGLVTLAPISGGTYNGSVAVASGWGRNCDNGYVSNTLQAANFTVIDNSVCYATFGALVQSSTLCVSAPKGTSTCQGDSGGPLVLLGSKTLIGVATFVASLGCMAGYPAGFSRVSSHYSWIAANAA